MSSSTLGRESSEIEVTNISKNGVWVLVGDEELFLSYDDYPWFKKASVEDVLHVVLQSPTHIFWPKLDLDISTIAIKEPNRFPLTAAT
jgi:hypothetical protein